MQDRSLQGGVGQGQAKRASHSLKDHVLGLPLPEGEIYQTTIGGYDAY